MHIPASLDGVLTHPTGSVLVINEAGTIMYVSDEACHSLKYGTGELHGRQVELLIPERYRLAHIGHRLRFTDDLRTRPMGAGLELFALCKDGSERRVAVSLNPIRLGLQTLMISVIRVLEPDFPLPSPK